MDSGGRGTGHARQAPCGVRRARGPARPELLQSALARPRHALTYASTPPTLAELAAAYGFGLARSHCFADGNKRIALAVIDVFLRMNGVALDAAEVDATEVIRDVASGQMDEAQLSAWIAANLKRNA